MSERKKHLQKGSKVVVKADGMKPLYVMLPEAQKTQFEAAAAAAGMSMREYVVNALEAQMARQSLTISQDTVGVARAGFAEDSRLQELMLRVGTLEQTVNALKERVDRELGPAFPPADWFDKDGSLKPPKPRNG